ncbi:MAG: hypothetical protein AAF561_07160 [Planctomycetota bacterium]
MLDFLGKTGIAGRNDDLGVVAFETLACLLDRPFDVGRLGDVGSPGLSPKAI